MTATTETVTGAIAKRENGPGAMIEQYRSDFTTVLPSHINGATWVRLAQGVLRRDKNLARIAQQNPASLMQALLECARLGHEPGTEAFYLVPMGNEIEGWEGYRGVIERIYRAGAVSNVKCEVVHENDTFRWSPTTMTKPEHEVDWFGDRGPIKGAYSYAEMRDGTVSKVVVINQAYLKKVRAMSRGSDKPTSPWVKWEEAMVLKTAIHRLEPFVPTSAEYMREQLRAIRDVQAEPVGTSALPPKPEPALGHAISDAHHPSAVEDEASVWDAEVVDVQTGEVNDDIEAEHIAALNREAAEQEAERTR
jgi:recombination protein RecT